MLFQRYIFGALLRSFLLLLVVLTGLVFVFSLGQALGRQEWSMALILSRLPFLLLFALGFALPLAALVGTLLTYGRMTADSEILALRMGGIHPAHFVVPAVVLGLALSAASLYVNGTAIPRATVRARAVTRDDLRNFLEVLEDQRIRSFRSKAVEASWSGVDEEGRLRDFRFLLKPDGGKRVEGEAALAWVSRDSAGEELTFYLRGVRAVREALTDLGYAESMTLTYPVAQLFVAEKAKERRGVLTNRELVYRIRRDVLLGHPSDSERLTDYRVELWSRIWLSFASFVAVLVAAPAGILFRRGSFVGSGVVALIVILVYYPLLVLAKAVAQRGTLSPAAVLAVPDLVLFVAGIVLLVRVIRR